MKLSVAAVLLLVASVTAVEKASHSLYIDTSVNSDIHVGPLGGRDCANVKESLKGNDPFVCLDVELKSDAITKEISENGAELLTYFYSGLHYDKVNKTDGPDFIARANPKSIGNLWKAIKKENASAFVKQMPYIVPLLEDGSKSLSVLGDNYKSALEEVAGSGIPGVLRKFVALTPDNLLKDHGAEIVELLPRGGISLGQLPKAVVAALTSKSETCEKMDPALLGGLNNDAASVLTHSCLSAIPNLDTYEGWNIEIRAIPEAAFEKPLELHRRAYHYMTKDQIGKLCSKVEGNDTPCEKVPLGTYLQANGHNMKPDCFAGALSKKSAEGDDAELKEAFHVLPKDILSKIREPADLKNIAEGDWAYISAEQKQPIFANLDNCSDSLSDHILKYHNNVKIETACFVKLSPVNQAEAFLRAQLPNDVLSEIPKSVVENWKSGDLTGIEVVGAASHVANVGPMIASMSLKANGDHICHLINSMDILEKLPLIQLYGSKECFDALAMDISLEDLTKLHPRVKSMISTDALVKKMDRSAYGKLTPESLGDLASSSSICSEMEIDNFEALSDDVLKAFPGKCLTVLSCIDKVEKSKFSLMPQTAFVEMNADQMARIDRSKLTNIQFGVASSALTDKTKHHAVRWTKDIVATFSVDLVPHIHHSAWDACPADAYAGLTKETFPAISPGSMVGMTAEKLGLVPMEARALISEAQVGEVGKNHSNATPHPLTAFKDVTVPDNVRKAIDARLAAEVKTPPPAEKKPTDG